MARLVCPEGYFYFLHTKYCGQKAGFIDPTFEINILLLRRSFITEVYEIDELTSENDIRDEATEQYIRDHVNLDYTSLTNMYPANKDHHL